MADWALVALGHRVHLTAQAAVWLHPFKPRPSVSQKSTRFISLPSAGTHQSCFLVKKKKQQLSSFYSRPSALLWNTLHSMCIHVYIHTCIYMYTYIRKYLLHNFTLSFFVALALASSHTVSITAKYALRRHCNCSHSKSTARVIGSLHAATQPLLLHPLVNGWTWLVQTCSNQKKREERAGNHRRDYVKWNCQRREAINHISPCSHCLWQLRQDSRQ